MGRIRRWLCRHGGHTWAQDDLRDGWLCGTCRSFYPTSQSCEFVSMREVREA